MRLRRLTSGVCSGSLHDFRWETVEVSPGSFVSPVGIIDNSIVCTVVSRFDGHTRAGILSISNNPLELESSTYFVSSAREIWSAGVIGFGESAFRFSVDGLRVDLSIPMGADHVDLDCINSTGVVGGSVLVRGEECGVVWRDREFEVLPAIRSVTAVTEAGQLYGVSHSGHPIRLLDGAEFGRIGKVVAVSLSGDALVASQKEVSIWRANGGVDAVAIRGYERVSVLGWSDAEVILGFGVTARGTIEHWLFDQKMGLRVLTNQEIDPGVYLQMVGAIGKNGEMAGIAVTDSERLLIRLF